MVKWPACPAATPRRFASDASGVTSVEYGLIVAIIGGAILVMSSAVQSGFSGLVATLAEAFSL
ncbi:Flp family type IVb pilin [Methyloceanibacter sp.]|uniref:Flp family type IVb pilin n=1 Tax=Methyloceanibacter sp. TaxID=1965321 RepID=UPI00208BF79B|nr:Flp family type IVb pilin [Methyloceanibacter sp.]GFO82193.1 MAG: hypothetical protein A49_18200 [Methyloceanibacter sp.]HML93069.1 Flp family type IVb pilin [Methyloceanibacter sp.]